MIYLLILNFLQLVWVILLFRTLDGTEYWLDVYKKSATRLSKYEQWAALFDIQAKRRFIKPKQHCIEQLQGYLTKRNRKIKWLNKERHRLKVELYRLKNKQYEG